MLLRIKFYAATLKFLNMLIDYSKFGPAYHNFKVEELVFVPEPSADFSGDNPFTRMAPIRGKSKNIIFDENYTYLDKSLKFKILNNITYFLIWTVAFVANWFRFGIKIKGREKIRQNRKLFSNGMITICNHVHRWDMISVLQAMRFRKAWIPMYSQPFNGKDGSLMKAVGGIAIPDNYNGLKKFDQALNELYSKKRWIHIFPESCSWNFYAPLRPFKIGAFNMAYRYSIPIIPLMISYRERKGWRSFFYKNDPLLTIHIGNPIIPNHNTPKKEETNRMRNLAHDTMLNMAGIASNPWPSSID